MERIEQIGSMLRRAPGPAVHALMWALLEEIETHPVLGPAARALPDINEQDHLAHLELAPKQMLAWGALALQTLRCYRSKGVAGGSLFSSVASFHRHDPAGVVQQVVVLFVEPILFWARHEVGALPLLHHAIDRWAQRLEWFERPDRADPGIVDERRLQVSLFKHLFDDGFDLATTSREAVTAHGRADFVLRTGEVVPVELKVWRGPKDTLKALSWASQATDYAHDLRCAAACLVIVSVCPTSRLRRDDDLGREFEAFDKRVHVVIADVAGVASSRDTDERPPHFLKRADLVGRKGAAR